MDKLISSWSSPVQTLPENYVFPLDTRPGEVSVPLCKNIPVIDLYQKDAIPQILHACQEFGFFQVVNHGVSEDLMGDTMRLFKEFFENPDNHNTSINTDDGSSESFKLCTSSHEYANEAVHFWRDNLRHSCYPLDEYMHLWPEKPTRYRDVVGKYTSQVRDLSTRILELICEGLGLEPGYFGDDLTNVQWLSVNHYPPCPDPSLALGLQKHADPNLITVLFQGGVYGLQVFKDGQWLGVEPLHNAFVINIGYQLQIISNGKLRSTEHRAVTNSKVPRTTVVSFINPRFDSIVEPAKALVNENNPPVYRAFPYKEFLKSWKEKGYSEETLEDYKVQA